MINDKKLIHIEKCNTLLFVFDNDKLLIKEDTIKLEVPTNEEFKSDDLKEFDGFYIGNIDEKKCYAVEKSDIVKLPKNYIFERLFDCKKYYKEDVYKFAGKAFQFLNWNRTHCYCGVCGTKLEPVKIDKSKVCPKCNKMIFPEISPAIIVAIIKDNSILLAHNRNFPGDLYSILAGFVEHGESLEETVKREVKEEVGIEIKNIKYFNSQPWPFPNSLMLGFIAEYKSGDIKVDGEEISHADWFTSNSLPTIPGHGSIAREIIDWYKENY